MLFFDRSIGKAVPLALRQVGVAVEIHDELYPQRPVPDQEWIGDATSRGSVLVTRDRRIRYRPAEVKAIAATGARVFVLRGKGPTRLDMLRAIMIAWERMHTIIETEDATAWIYEIDAGGRLRGAYPPS